jgi:hypothetical protein
MEATEAASDSEAAAVRFRWLIIAGITVAILTCSVLIHVIQVRNIRRVASAISVGDNRAQVIRLLGMPRVTYYTGFPAGGGDPTVLGACYGGLLNSLRGTIDGCVHIVLGSGRPPSRLYRLYQRFGAQSVEDWPVVIEFDQAGIVAAVNR